jgi:hypothetical protein
MTGRVDGAGQIEFINRIVDHFCERDGFIRSSYTDYRLPSLRKITPLNFV